MDSKNTYLDMELLRFTTAGSVDDGKSTLIGRLLYDSKSIFEDQLEAVRLTSQRKGHAEVDLSLLTDGLKAEREQGITIDVAYRYFATPKRKFIIADTPGHVQYTRNMVTGASTANLAIILADARHGIVEQTCRHAYIASLLMIPHMVLCVNKMDLVDHQESVFQQIVKDFDGFASKLEIKDIHFVPISALNGDNIVNKSNDMPWYQGPTLMYLLEHLHIGSDYNHLDARFPVQYVLRPQKKGFEDFRGYAGRVASGIFRKDDEITVLPSGFSSKITALYSAEKSIEEAHPNMAISMTIADNLDISRGDMIVKINNQPNSTQELDIMVCWFAQEPMELNKRYVLKHTTRDVRCILKEIVYKMDIHKLQRIENVQRIGMNDIARIKLRTQSPVFFDSYKQNRLTGSLILIDESTNSTVGVGMIH
ncbi:MAG: sulfate adenylyltransferase [Bacteroidetes bacterium]|nr:sulfate adenylyltransferase [Bacteroidota bacterium]